MYMLKNNNIHQMCKGEKLVEGLGNYFKRFSVYELSSHIPPIWTYFDVTYNYLCLGV